MGGDPYSVGIYIYLSGGIVYGRTRSPANSQRLWYNEQRGTLYYVFYFCSGLWCVYIATRTHDCTDNNARDVAVGPLFLGPLSEVYGRTVIIQASNIFFLGRLALLFAGTISNYIDLVWNLACGFARNKSEFIAFRFLSGVGGSAPLAVSSRDS